MSEPLPTNRRTAFVLAALCLVLTAWGVQATRGYFTDDVFIHLRFARSLSEGRGFTFNSCDGQIYGCTSPLWVGVLACFEPLRLDRPEMPAKIIGWALMAFNLAMVAALSVRLFRRLGRPAAWAVVPVTLWGVNPALIRWQGSGMETPLFLSLILAFLLVQRPFASQSILRAAGSGAIVGLAFLVRPEGMFLAGALGVAGLWAVASGPDRRRAAFTLAAAALGCLAVVAPWLAWAHHAFGTIVPNTVLAKGAARAPIARTQYAADLFRAALQTASVELFVIGAGAAAWLTSRERFLPRLASFRDEAITWLAFPALFLSVHAFFGGYAISRYFTALMPCAVLFMVPALDRIASLRMLRGREAASCLALGTTLATANALLTVWLFVPHMRMHAEGNARVKELALKLREIARPGDSVVANDVGIVGYWSEVPVVDLVGLVTREMIDHNRRGDGVVYLCARKPRFYILHGEQGADWLARIAPQTKEIARARYPSFTLFDRRGDEYVLGEVVWPQDTPRP